MSTHGLAAFARRFGQPLSLEEYTFPDPVEDEVLVKVEFSGICHTDLHALRADWSLKPTLPFIPGHEGTGVVYKAGHSVRNVKEGDRVGLPWLHAACGVCEWCLSGRETLCPKAEYGGFTANGTFAEYCLAPASHVVPLPHALSKESAAPILCAGVTMWKALKQANLRAGEWVAIIGAGGLGHLGIQYARAMGLRVVAVDTNADRLASAGDLGASLAVDAREYNVGERLQREIGGVHGVIVTAPDCEAARAGISGLRRGGTCVLVGLPGGDVPMPIVDIVVREITICGSLVGTRLDVQEALAFAADGHVRPVIKEYPFEQVNDALECLSEGRVLGRLVLHMK